MVRSDGTFTLMAKTLHIAATATTIAAFVLHSQYYSARTAYLPGYPLEVVKVHYLISGSSEGVFGHDIVVDMSPKRQYAVQGRIVRITKGEPTIVLPEG